MPSLSFREDPGRYGASPHTARLATASSNSGFFSSSTAPTLSENRLDRLCRRFSQGIRFKSSTALSDRLHLLERIADWLRIEQSLLEKSAVVPIRSSRLKKIEFLVDMVNKQRVFERVARGDRQILKIYKAYFISSPREAYWLNQKLRKGAAFKKTNIWKRTDRFDYIVKVLNTERRKDRGLPLSARRGLAGLIGNLKARIRGRWKDVRKEAEKLIRYLSALLFTEKAAAFGKYGGKGRSMTGGVDRAGTARAKHSGFHRYRFPALDKDEKEKHPACFGPLKTASSKRAGQDFVAMICRFQEKMAGHLCRTMELGPECKGQLQAFLRTMIPRNLPECSKPIQEVISKRVDRAFVHYPQVARSLARYGRAGERSLRNSFTLKISEFYQSPCFHQASPQG